VFQRRESGPDDTGINAAKKYRAGRHAGRAAGAGRRWGHAQTCSGSSMRLNPTSSRIAVMPAASASAANVVEVGAGSCFELGTFVHD